MAMIPFVKAQKTTTTNGGTFSFTYKAPNNQKFILHDVMWVIGAAFDLTKVQDDAGRFYSDISTTHPIPSTELKQSNTDVTLLNFPAIPLTLPGGTTITFEIKDTGGGGAVTLILSGELEIAG